MQVPVADPAGKIGTQPFGDHGMHHVKRRHPAAAGRDATVEHKARVSRVEMRKGLFERRCVFPVNCKVSVVEQTRSGEHEGPAGYAADPNTETR